MSARVKHYRALNRLLRSAYSRAIDIREDLRKGEARKEDAQRLMREVQAVSGDVGQGAALHRSRVQYLQNLGINHRALAARETLKALGPMGIRGMLPAIIDRANSGDEEAISFAAAAVSVLGEMDQAQRPMTATKFARMIRLDDYDKASVELEECQFMLDAMAVSLPRLMNGQLPTANDLMAIGIKERELREGQGLRDAAELVADDAELFVTPPEPEEEPADAPNSGDEQPDPANADGQDRSGETDPPAADTADAGEADSQSEDHSRSSDAEGQ